MSQSYDATTHFESTVQDVINTYSKITGKVISCFFFHKYEHDVSLSIACLCYQDIISMGRNLCCVQNSEDRIFQTSRYSMLLLEFSEYVLRLVSRFLI